jgi:hypothetical protein
MFLEIFRILLKNIYFNAYQSPLKVPLAEYKN